MIARLDKLLRGRRSGMTLLELLVVIAIIGILTGLLLGGISAVMKSTRRKKAKTYALALANALKTYRSDYGAWPNQHVAGDTGEAGTAGTFSDMTEIIGALTNNPRGIMYMDLTTNMLRVVGGELHYIDPWQRPFVVAMDRDGDGTTHLQASLGGANVDTNVKDSVAVFSWGMIPANDLDHVHSWDTK